MLCVRIDEHLDSNRNLQTAGFLRFRNRRREAASRDHDPLGTGIYVFRSPPLHLAPVENNLITAQKTPLFKIVRRDG